MNKVTVDAEDLPVAALADSANEHIDRRCRNTPLPASVAHFCGMFEILRSDRYIFKIAQLTPYPLEPRIFPNSRKYFLSNRSQQLSASILDELPQVIGNEPLVVRQVGRVAAQCERPYRCIDEDHHPRFRLRSVL